MHQNGFDLKLNFPDEHPNYVPKKIIKTLLAVLRGSNYTNLCKQNEILKRGGTK